MNNSIWADLEGELSCRMHIYRHLVEPFSQRAFKKQGDILWAFTGVLKHLDSAFPKGFIWGLPKDILDEALLWSEAGSCRNVHPRLAQHTITTESGCFQSLPFPSWSWLSTMAPVSFWDMCESSIISKVIWHEPFKPVHQILVALSHDRAKEEKQQEKVNILSEAASDFLDYKLLHFTAQTAMLTLKLRRNCIHSNPVEEWGSGTSTATRTGVSEGCWKAENRPEESVSRGSLQQIGGTIHSLTGESIGVIDVPSKFFDIGPERSGEVVLLSSNAPDASNEFCVVFGEKTNPVTHVDRCMHKCHNVMLVEWVDGIAYRWGLGMVGVDDWAKIKTEEKKIILG
jgi:hypothetical protein